MDYLKAFIVGGLICAVGQILIDKTKLTPAKNFGYVCCGWCIFTAYKNISSRWLILQEPVQLSADRFWI